MKKLFFLLLISFTILNLLLESIPINFQVPTEKSDSLYNGGLLNCFDSKTESLSNYKIDVTFNSKSFEISAIENIIWRNETTFSTNEIFFYLFPGEKNLNSNLVHDRLGIPFMIDELFVNGKHEQLVYDRNKNGALCAKINIDHYLHTSDSVLISFKYRLKISPNYFGYTHTDENRFIIFSRWFPKVAQFINGKWYYPPRSKFTDYNYSFANYDVTISADENYIIDGTGNLISKIQNDDKIQYHFSRNRVQNFCWFASNNIQLHTAYFERKNNTGIFIKSYLQNKSGKYLERITSAIKNSLNYLEKNFGVYPYNSITLADLPAEINSDCNSYPAFITIKTELFSPFGTLAIERQIIEMVVEQYFGGVVSSDKTKEAWLSNGVSAFVAQKIINEFYGKESASFKLVKFIPIYGMNFFSYNEIPLIYTLGNYALDEGAASIKLITQSRYKYSISTYSYLLPDKKSYLVNTKAKPELLLLSLERYIGSEKLFAALNEYYNNYLFKSSQAADLIEIFNKISSKDLTWFFKSYYYESCYPDFRINKIEKAGKNLYNVFAERRGMGRFKTELYFYTDSETIIKKWEDESSSKVFTFFTKEKVIGAEIDPERKNLFDPNFANNSYRINHDYFASLSLSLKLFFWIQNALMILGSLG